MSGFKFDPSKSGLRKILKEYEEFTLRYLWEVDENGVGSALVWETMFERLPPGKSRSRTSVIFFLNKLVDQGVLGFKVATGKGGQRKIYFPLMNERDYVRYIIRTLYKSMARDFPEIAKEVLMEYNA